MHTFIISIIFIHLWSTASGFYLNLDYSIQELNSTRASDFLYEAAQWQASSLTDPSQNYYLCGKWYNIGGYNVLGSIDKKTTLGQSLSRAYTGLKPHSIIYFSYTLSQLDKWMKNDYYQIQFDSVVINSTWRSDWEEWSNGEFVCGVNSSPDQVGSRIFGRVIHSDSSLTLSFISMIHSLSGAASVGFRDIRLIFAVAPQSTLDETISMNSDDEGLTIPAIMCGISYGVKYNSQTCQCAEGQYADAFGQCMSCDSRCTSCFGPSNKECYWCADGAEWTGAQCKNKPSFLSLVRLVQYTRYLDIYFPPRLRSFLDRPASNLLPINSEAMMPVNSRDNFSVQQIPSIFAEYNLHSNFLINYWGELLSLIAISIVGLFLMVYEKIQLNRLKHNQQIFIRQLCLLFKWNFPLLLIAFNIDYIILFASLQLYSPNLHIGSNILGFVFCLITVFLIPAFVFVFYRIRKLLTANFKYQDSDLKNKSRYSSYYIFFGGYRRDFMLTKFFYILYLVRIGLPSIISCALYSFPKAQTALYFVINCLMLIFIIVKRPLTRRTNLIQLIIQESISAMINLFLIILAAHDAPEWRNSRLIISLGDAVIAGNILINVVVIIFFIIKVAIETRNIWRLRKIKQYIISGAWIRLAGIYIQQGAFGFEEIFQEKIVFDSATQAVQIKTDQPADSVNTKRPSFYMKYIEACLIKLMGDQTNTQPQQVMSPSSPPLEYTTARLPALCDQEHEYSIKDVNLEAGEDDTIEHKAKMDNKPSTMFEARNKLALRAKSRAFSPLRLHLGISIEESPQDVLSEERAPLEQTNGLVSPFAGEIQEASKRISPRREMLAKMKQRRLLKIPNPIRTETELSPPDNLSGLSDKSLKSRRSLLKRSESMKSTQDHQPDLAKEHPFCAVSIHNETPDAEHNGLIPIVTDTNKEDVHQDL